jgi:putative endonuclease
VNYIYILRCGDGSLYTGWTNNLAGRLAAHQRGKGCKYTRSHQPVELVYSEELETKELAMSREWHIKKMSRQEKLELIRNYNKETAI